MSLPLMNVSSISPGLDATRSGKGSKASDAGGQFESLLIAQMLKSMREEGSGWLGTGEDKAADSAMALAEEHLASSLTAAGGFGLARLVTSGLEAPGVSGAVQHVPGSKGSGS